jgi:nitroreductase
MPIGKTIHAVQSGSFWQIPSDGGLSVPAARPLGTIAPEPVTHNADSACDHLSGPLALPKPRADFGVSLAKALSSRRSTREFDGMRKLSLQNLSELLWCAYGVTRNVTSARTAPSWRHANEIEIFAAMDGGVWRYDPVSHHLLPHLSGDVRLATGVQDFVAVAPLELIYVAERNYLVGLSPGDQSRVASADTGFIGQNVYLYCASEGLATVFRTSFDHLPLERALRLSHTQFITFVQTVGYPEA